MAEADRGDGGGAADRGPLWEGGLVAEADRGDGGGAADRGPLWEGGLVAEADRGEGRGAADRGPLWEGGLLVAEATGGTAEAPQHRSLGGSIASRNSGPL